MRNNGWTEEAWRLAIVLLGGALFGALIGHLAATTLVLLGLYSVGHLYDFKRFISWMDDPVSREMPIRNGVWGDVYARVSRLLNSQAQRERRLQILLDQFQSAAEALPDAVVALGPSDEIRWVNQAAQDVLGLRAPGDYGRPLANLFRAPAFQQFLSARDFRKPLELPAPGRDGQRLSVRAVCSGQDQLLIIVQDVTERYRVEQIRRDFVANVSHELRTPLTVISGFVENMHADGELCPVPWRKPLALISEQTARMQQIVEDLLLLARLEGGGSSLRQEAVDVAAMLEMLAVEARLLASEDIDISVDIASGWHLEAEPGLLRSAISNLVVNAVHHTPPGGEIVLHWVDEPHASCIVVEDTGEGIAPEHIPRLSERFYRVDTGRSRERGGTGLGLAIVKHVLQVHEGGLEIMSTPGEGSQFICRFPARLRAEPRGTLGTGAGGRR